MDYGIPTTTAATTNWEWNQNQYMHTLSAQDHYNYRKRRIDLAIEIIRGVRVRPLLFDIRIPISRRTREARNKLWAEIQSVLPDPVSLEQLYKTWKYLRDRYIKCRKTRKLHELDGTTKIANFRFYKLMKFLEPTLITSRYAVSLDPLSGTPSTTPTPNSTSFTSNNSSNQSQFVEEEDDEDYNDDYEDDDIIDDDDEDENMDFSNLTTATPSTSNSFNYGNGGSNERSNGNPITSAGSSFVGEVIDLDDDNSNDDSYLNNLNTEKRENVQERTQFSISEIKTVKSTIPLYKYISMPKESNGQQTSPVNVSRNPQIQNVKKMQRYTDDELENIIYSELNKLNNRDDFDKLGDIVAERIRKLTVQNARKCERDILSILTNYEIENEEEKIDEKPTNIKIESI